MNLLRERYRIASCTDKGCVKDVNQDSFSVQKMLIHGKEVLLAVVCDGMGGLEKGEVASVMVSARFEKWFAQELPVIIVCFRRKIRPLFTMEGSRVLIWGLQ